MCEAGSGTASDQAGVAIGMVVGLLVLQDVVYSLNLSKGRLSGYEAP